MDKTCLQILMEESLSRDKTWSAISVHTNTALEAMKIAMKQAFYAGRTPRYFEPDTEWVYDDLADTLVQVEAWYLNKLTPMVKKATKSTKGAKKKKTV